MKHPTPTERLTSLKQSRDKVSKIIEANWRGFQDNEELARSAFSWFTTGGKPEDFTPEFLAYLCDRLSLLVLSAEEWDEMKTEQRDRFIFSYVMTMQVDDCLETINATSIDLCLHSYLLQDPSEGRYAFPWTRCLQRSPETDDLRVVDLHKCIFNLLSQGAVLRGEAAAFRCLSRILEDPAQGDSLNAEISTRLAWDVACIAICLEVRDRQRPTKSFVEAVVTELWHQHHKPHPKTWSLANKAFPDLFAAPRTGPRFSEAEKQKRAKEAANYIQEVMTHEMRWDLDSE